MWAARNWTRPERLWIGAFTLVPVLTGLAIPIRAFFAADSEEGFESCVLCIMHPLMVFVFFLLYVPALFNNSRINAWSKGFWALGFLLAGIVALPAYWAFHIWGAPYQPDGTHPEAP